MRLKLKEKVYDGKLITFCGLDGCGKTTMIKMLEQHFIESGITPVITKQPTDSIRNSDIFRTYMDNPDHNSFDYRALSLSAAGDRIQHTNKYIVPLLEAGETVISDRYFYSCLANLKARGYHNDTWIYEIANDIQKPDLSFFLDVDVETALLRVRSRPSEKNKFVDIELQYKLREQYLQIAKEIGGIVISSCGDSETCFNQVLHYSESVLLKYV